MVRVVSLGCDAAPYAARLTAYFRQWEPTVMGLEPERWFSHALL